MYQISPQLTFSLIRMLEAFLSCTGPLSNIILFLAGIPESAKWRSHKTTLDVSSLPYVVGLLNALCWTGYGFQTCQIPIWVVNVTGTVLFSFYIVTFHKYTPNRSHFDKQLSVFGTIFIGQIVYLITIGLVYGFNESTRHLGFMCAAIAIGFCASPISQTYGVYVGTVGLSDVPFVMIALTLVVMIQWTLYGLLRQDYFVVIPNVIGSTISGVQSVYIGFKTYEKTFRKIFSRCLASDAIVSISKSTHIPSSLSPKNVKKCKQESQVDLVIDEGSETEEDRRDSRATPFERSEILQME